ncbi:Ditrans,polycis-undecaprenyl-diphosphate synthase ((2E,6E)-farnesyl-diphosphate specific) [Gammaproteobacteria bacterium MOLA455]|nr:Ditrans,polycis-undecaprenyl-diphosphate synthase ((2E,6E)-farnesyl-diphosphate specific) [Gammaproteobacteria bacterium MOLA455]
MADSGSKSDAFSDCENVAHPLKHVAVIMDGNNRWAKQRGLSGVAGHEAGVERIRDILHAAKTRGIEVVTLFAFSSENWKRPELEVRGLMALFSSYLKKEAKKLRDDGVRLKVVGNRSHFSDRLKRLIDDAETLTASGQFTLVLCVDYGGRWDIASAAQKIATEVQMGRLRASDITEATVGKFLQTEGLPDPDLCLRTAGEQRISNFLLWQMAYTEFYFANCYWPDFDAAALNAAVDEYYSRQRRFGLRDAADYELASRGTE